MENGAGQRKPLAHPLGILTDAAFHQSIKPNALYGLGQRGVCWYRRKAGARGSRSLHAGKFVINSGAWAISTIRLSACFVG